MKIDFDGNFCIISELEEFDPRDVFTCGQAFRWYEEADGSFTFINHGRVANAKKVDGKILLKDVDKNSFDEIFYNYFDLDRDYKRVIEELSKDDVMKSATEYGKGIRILNQDKFETIISFIISANNQIPRIKKSIEKISEMYGKFLGEDENRKYFSFPSAEELSKAKPEDLREFARVGFRDKRIVETANLINSGIVSIDEIEKMNLEDARAALQVLPGVGPKVADCILLFAFDRKESFPVDVWIKRVMEELYLKEETPKSKIAMRGREVFGKNAGFANQYLFYYGRENKLGR
ncbi:DNA-3-methyladenine glycosylase family protein [Peptoniphilus sp.]|uniref:DNA-3-methyladenine glycosylase family protein n=1 Tax=Peptoniphilus sp. TaxID=1971214 RepID=UPI002A828DF7|nr:DNA glycosylase [Peptoniphilus sp.]MDY3902199.1 DNA glycosylase [Peptoniphilus sp.]